MKEQLITFYYKTSEFGHLALFNSKKKSILIAEITYKPDIF